MITFFKSLHFTALLLWTAALLAMPIVLRRAGELASQQEFNAYRRTVFWGYVGAMTPAAVIAIASGTVLVFLRETFTVWFMVKLLGVGLMVVAHAWLGHAVSMSGESGGTYRPPAAWLPMGLTAAGASLVLLMVLGKPIIDVPAMLEGIDSPLGYELPAWFRGLYR